MTAEGADKMLDLTTTHRTKPLAALWKGELRSAPRVFSAISQSAQLSPFFTIEEASQMIEKGVEP